MDKNLSDLVDSLFVVRGTLSEVRRSKGMLNEMNSTEQGIAAGAAISAAALNSAAGTVGGMQTIGYKGRPVEIFEARLGEMPIFGCFSHVAFSVGDEVEAVISKNMESGAHRCVALARLNDKVLWTCGSGQGHKVKRRKRKIGVVSLMGLIYAVLVLFASSGGFTSSDLYSLGIGALAVAGIGIVLYFTEPKSHREAVALERRALSLLGFENPDWMDVSKEFAFFEPPVIVGTSEHRSPLCYDAFHYGSVRVLEHTVLNAAEYRPTMQL